MDTTTNISGNAQAAKAERSTSPESEFGSRDEGDTVGGSMIRKRPSRAGTRSVSTLSATQLERKRANDREAQRAIRQRTKEHIERLERRIAELTTGPDANSRLLDALRRNKELEGENTILKMRLEQLGFSSSVAENSASWQADLSSKSPVIGSEGLDQPVRSHNIGRSDAHNVASAPHHHRNQHFPHAASPWHHHHHQQQQPPNYIYKRSTPPTSMGEHTPVTLSSWSFSNQAQSSNDPHSGSVMTFPHMILPQGRALSTPDLGRTQQTFHGDGGARLSQHSSNPFPVGQTITQQYGAHQPQQPQMFHEQPQQQIAPTTSGGTGETMRSIYGQYSHG